jgi:integrase
LRLKLPKYINAYIDRNGKARYYFRRAGFKSVTLPGLPWSPEFMQAYTDALAGQPVEIGAARVVPGSMHALAISYYHNSCSDYLRMKPISQQTRRRVIEHFCRELDVKGQRMGDKQAATLQREHIKGFMAARADRPESANALLNALRALMRHAIEIKMRTDDPTLGLKRFAPRSRQGYPTWQESEIAQFRAYHPGGSLARLALELGLGTGQAKQDVVAMGPQHIRDGVLTWVRRKTAQSTGIEVYIEIEPDLRQAIDATPNGHLTFLARDGVPFTPETFGKWFRVQCDKAGLPHLAFHGLRKAVARRMAESGCTPHEIAAITGHATLKEVERYTKAASRKQLAQSGLAKVRRRTATA